MSFTLIRQNTYSSAIKMIANNIICFFYLMTLPLFLNRFILSINNHFNYSLKEFIMFTYAVIAKKITVSEYLYFH